MAKQVTEADFRLPEYRNAKPDDYEFRDGDGALVRKDRWKTGIQQIASALGHARTQYEIPDIVSEACALISAAHDWETEDLPQHEDRIDIRLGDGSILLHGQYLVRGWTNECWTWRTVELSDDHVAGWRHAAASNE